MPGLTRLRRRAGGDRGAVTALVAILMSSGVLLGMTAYAVDIGTLYAYRDQALNAANAAALAAAELCNRPGTRCGGLDDPTDLSFASDGRIFIAERGGRVLVFRDGRLQPAPALTLSDATTADRQGLLAMAVDPAYRGFGLGKRLIAECLDGLKGAGLERANILVAKDNPRGREFWKSCGWEDLDGAAAMGKDI